MSYSTYLLLALAILPPLKNPNAAGKPAGPDLPEVMAPVLERLRQLVAQFLQQRVTPADAYRFEQQLREELRELGRAMVQWTYNRLEPEAATLPKHVRFEAGPYTRLNQKTPQNVWTLFGQIRLHRIGYRPTDKTGDATIFPLALSMGLVHGATPALAERAARLLGATGMTQSQTLQRLREDHGVGWGVKKLRQVSEVVSAALAEQRHETQAAKLLDWLEQAAASRGKHKPVLSVGRDGITLPMRCKGGQLFEVATTGTVSVLDRRGQRLGTVYLAHTPEPGQKTMSSQLTRLLRDVLQRGQGPLPRLGYITDAGDNETAYYEKTLCRMKHPHTGKKLEWIRVVDYYHASQRIWKMAEALFGQGPRTTSWARKMQKLLKKPGGVHRVLHSAANLRALQRLGGTRLRDFKKAYGYLRSRIRYLRYADYRAMGLPLGSGVTEAGCKIVYTQRLKLSGMGWEESGAQTILNLRVLQLSRVWDAAYERVLNQFDEAQVPGQPYRSAREAKSVA
jgi:hypothetical protein